MTSVSKENKSKKYEVASLIYNNKYAEAKKLLEENGDEVNVNYSYYGKSALYLAAYFGKLELVKLLLDKGANINFRESSFLMTPLYSAISNYEVFFKENVKKEKLDVIEELIKRGADVNIPLDNGSTPLRVAINKNLFDIVKLLVEHGAIINDNIINMANEPIKSYLKNYLIKQREAIKSVLKNRLPSPLNEKIANYVLTKTAKGGRRKTKKQRKVIKKKKQTRKMKV